MSSNDRLTHRFVHAFGREIIDHEAVISREHLLLRDQCEAARPIAAIVHRHVRVILAEAAQISLILFPISTAKEKTNSRALLLRREFQVPENSLLKHRTMRHHLVHLDERLDEWANTSAMATFGRGMLGSRFDAQNIGLNTEDILGLFDPTTQIYSFKEDDVDIDELVYQVQIVSRNARRKLNAQSQR